MSLTRCRCLSRPPSRIFHLPARNPKDSERVFPPTKDENVPACAGEVTINGSFNERSGGPFPERPPPPDPDESLPPERSGGSRAPGSVSVGCIPSDLSPPPAARGPPRHSSVANSPCSSLTHPQGPSGIIPEMGSGLGSRVPAGFSLRSRNAVKNSWLFQRASFHPSELVPGPALCSTSLKFHGIAAPCAPCIHQHLPLPASSLERKAAGKPFPPFPY